MDDIKKEKFVLPPAFIEELYELTGAGDTYKGFFLAIVDEDGEPSIYFKHDTKIVELGLRAAVQKYLNMVDESESGIFREYEEEFVQE